jgi:hypothetical protein
MIAGAIFRPTLRSTAQSVLMLPFALLFLLALGAGVLVSYLLWPSWATVAGATTAPEVPMTVAGVLFEVPSAAIRVAVQRQPGPHERIDLVFMLPALAPRQADANSTAQSTGKVADGTATVPTTASEPLFVTIAGRGAELPPVERLRTIYPHYVESQAFAGPDGLAILPFRRGTPYDGEDLVYLATDPEQFFALCTRPVGFLPGTCIREQTVGAAELTLRFPRRLLTDWRNVTASIDQLVAQLHPQPEDPKSAGQSN